MQQQAGAGQVFEETNPQPGAIRRAFDQSRNIGNHKAAMRLDADHAEIGMQGGKGIVGHLGFGRGNRANKGRFAGIGHAQQADIRQHF